MSETVAQSSRQPFAVEAPLLQSKVVDPVVSEDGLGARRAVGDVAVAEARMIATMLEGPSSSDRLSAIAIVPPLLGSAGPARLGWR